MRTFGAKNEKVLSYSWKEAGNSILLGQKWGKGKGALSSNSRGNAVSDGSSFRFLFTSIGVTYPIPGIPHMLRKR